MGMTRRVRALALPLVVLALTAGCSTVREADPTGLLGGGEDVSPEKVSNPAATDAPYPNLSSVPLTPPRRPSSQDRRLAIKEGLISDRGNAAYSDEPLRERPAGAEGELPAQVAALGPDAPAQPPPPPRLLEVKPPARTTPETPSAASPAEDPPPKVKPATKPEGELASRPERKPATAPGEAAQEKQTASGDAAQAEQTASLPPPTAPSWPLRLRFEAGKVELTAEHERRLTALARRLRAQPGPRIEIRAYAEPIGEDASQARRLSLRRALAVRNALTTEGLAATRMDVRALGATGERGPLDRVDIALSDG